MNILRRKLQAAGMTGYCNTDPFTASTMPQQQFAQPQQQQPQQQTPPVAAPNAYAPHTQPIQDPDHGNGMPSASPEGLTPLDQIMQSVYNGQQQQQAPQQQAPAQQPPQQQPTQQPTEQPSALDLTKLSMDSFTKHAAGMDFTGGVGEDTIAKFAVDPATGQPKDLLGGLMEMMNVLGRNVYAQGVHGSSTLAGNSIQQQLKQFQGTLPSMMNRHQVARSIEGMGVHKALEPTIAQHAKQLLANNPNITPEAATQQIQDLVQALSGHLTQQYQHNPEQEAEEAAAHGSSILLS